MWAVRAGLIEEVMVEQRLDSGEVISHLDSEQKKSQAEGKDNECVLK